MVSEMKFSTVNDPRTALEGRTNLAPRGVLEIIEQLAAVRSQKGRTARPGAHVSDTTYCPGFGAARGIRNEAPVGPEDLIYNRDTDSKMLIGTWMHIGFEKWFLDHMEWAHNLTDEEIEDLDLPGWLRKDLDRLRAEGGEWDGEVPVELPEIGLVGTLDLQRKPDPPRGISAAVVDIKVGINLSERVRLCVLARRALKAGEVPPDECFDVPKKHKGFKPTSWQCKEPYCACSSCPHWIPIKVIDEE
jgi:hypothetical protein